MADDQTTSQEGNPEDNAPPEFPFVISNPHDQHALALYSNGILIKIVEAGQSYGFEVPEGGITIWRL